MKKALISLLAPILTFLLITSFVKWALIPWASRAILSSLKSYTASESPVTISAAQLRIQFFRPMLVIDGLEVLSHQELTPIFEKLTVDRISLQLDVFHILTGRLQFSAAIFENPKVTIQMDPLLNKEKKAEDLPLEEIFKLLGQIPLQRVWIENLDLRAESQKHKSSLHIQKALLTAALDPKRLGFKTEMTDLEVLWRNKKPFRFSLSTQGLLTPESFKLLSAHFGVGQSALDINGLLTAFEKVSTEPQGQINTHLDVDLSELEQIIRDYLPEQRIPHLSGQLKSTAKVQFNGRTDITGDIDLKTDKVFIGQFDIGKTSIRGRYHNQEIELDEVNAIHPAGILKLTQSNIKLRSPWEFVSQVQIQKLDLQDLFVSLGLTKIPVGLKIRGGGPCQGQLQNFQITCEPDLLGSSLYVHQSASPPSQPIVEVASLGAKGTLSVDLERVSYKAQVSLAEDQGQSEGVIEYAKGFKISFQSPSVDFKNIQNLVNLKFEGHGPVDGVTEGDASHATLQMKLRPSQFSFENYQLGALETDLTYEAGHLKLNQMAGLIDQTQIFGKIDIDLHDHAISGALQFPKANLKDIAFAFERYYRLPLNIQGPGNGQLEFFGPLNFWKMSYDLKANFRNGTIGSESFGELIARVSSAEGQVKAQELSLIKGSSRIDVQASMTPERDINFKAQATNFKLEESELITQINSQVYGNLKAEMSLTGSVLDPNLEGSLSLTDTMFIDQEVPDSSVLLSLNPQRTQVTSKIFGDIIDSSLTIPRSEGGEALQIKLKSKRWAFGHLLALLGGTHLQQEYDTLLTTDINLKSASGRWNDLTGQANITEFLMRRGQQVLQNSQVMTSTWEHGKISLENFQLDGPETRIEIKGTNFDFSNLDLSISAKIDLKLFILLLPFFDDLGGPLQTQASITGSWDHPQILGNAQLDSIFFKFRGFPHPIEKIKTEITFSHSKILLPEIKGALAGGTLLGSGELQILGIRDVPTHLKISATGLNLIVPEKIRSAGSAELALDGNWFPFTLSGIYKIQSGLFEKEFAESSSGALHLQQSLYLPQTLKEEVFNPLTLDLTLQFDHSIQIRNSQMDGTVVGGLQVKGPLRNPILLGKLETEKGSKIIFKDKVFDIQTGYVNFTNPQDLDPEIFLSARSRVNDYDINLIVQGHAKSINPSLSSVPPLSENDLFSLLALGITSTNLEQNVQSGEQAKQTATEVFGTVINQTVGRGFKSATGLNFQVSNSYDNTKNISVPKLILSRQLGKKTSLQYSRHLSGSNNTSDVKLQYQLNQNLSAVGSFEARAPQEDSTDKSLSQDQQSIFGLDLEFRREFK